MKEIIRGYGMTLLAVIASVAVFGFVFFGLDIFESYSLLAEANTKNANMSKSHKYYDIAEVDVPQIRISKVPEKGEKYPVTDLFREADSREEFESVRVMEVWLSGEGGELEEVKDYYKSSDNTLSFAETGTYRAKVAVVDNKGVANTQWIYFVVEV